MAPVAEDSGATCGNLVWRFKWVLGPCMCLRPVENAQGEGRGMEPQTGLSQWEAANHAAEWLWARTASSDAQQGSPLPAPQAIPRHWLGGAAAFPSSSSCRPRGQVGGRSLLPHPGPGRELQGACPCFPVAQRALPAPGPTGSSHGAGLLTPFPGPRMELCGRPGAQ